MVSIKLLESSSNLMRETAVIVMKS